MIQSGTPVKESCGDGIKEGEHYLNPQNLRILNRNSSLEDSEPFPLQTIVGNAHKWYQDHSLQKQSQLFYSLL